MKNINKFEKDLPKFIEKYSRNYICAATFFDNTKPENNLTHVVSKKDFPEDDIYPSVQRCGRLLNPAKPIVETPAIVYSKELFTYKEPLKIAVITHFNRAPDNYSPAKAVKNQIKILKEHGHDVTLFCQEGSKLEWDCNMEKVVPSFKREKNIVNEEIKDKFIKILGEKILEYDLVITHDLYIDDCITYREAIKTFAFMHPVDGPRWLHWARSGVGRHIDFYMPKAKYVYMNRNESAKFAQMIGVKASSVKVVYNEKEPDIFFKWNPITKSISESMDLEDKDIIQIYPMCSTRMDAKGVDCVIRLFAELKSSGENVALIICNANSSKRKDEINYKLSFAESLGLGKKDIMFTSEATSFDLKSEIPNIVVSELMKMSNLFAFPTIAEVCPNVLLEAAITKNLIICNDRLPLLYDFVKRENCIPFDFYGADKTEYEILAKNIIKELKSNKIDMAFRSVWRNHNSNAIYRMLQEVIYEK